MSDGLLTLFRYELKQLLRDRRTILIAVVAPLVLFPLFILVTRAIEDRDEARLDRATYRWALDAPPGEAEALRSLVREALARVRRDEAAAVGDAGWDFAEMEPGGADSLLADGDLQILVEPGEPEDGVPVVRLSYRSTSDASRRARQLLQDGLVALRQDRRDALYASRGLPVPPDEVAPVELRNVATAEREGGAILGLALTPFLLFLMLTGGSIVAVDAISGEKERGTLETLLTTALTRREIVAAKQLAVIVVGLAVAVVNVLNLLLYLVFGVLELPEDFAVAVSAPDLLLLLVLVAPLAVLVSSVLLLLSGWAKSYKEYQVYFFPVFLLFLLPSAAGALPGMDLRSAISLVPIAGVSVGVREILLGERDWLFLLVALASTSGAAWWASRLTSRALSTERLIGGAELDEADLLGGPLLFPRRVVRWFLVMWAVFFVVSLWFGSDLGIRGQILVNLVVIFFGASLLMVHRYRLDRRRAWGLRAPHPAAWLAVAVGAPSLLVLGLGLAELVNAFLFPVPREILEAFGDFAAADSLPLWQTVLLLSVAPGIFEEIAFRGMLLQGLRRFLRPVPLTLVVGLAFGLFHVSLFRIVPTAFLGSVLAAVTLLSGSLYPAMVWHALNNALVVVPAHVGWIGQETVVPSWGFAVAGVGLALSLGLLWRVRRRLPAVWDDEGASRPTE